MPLSINEMLFYGGLISVALVLILGGLYFGFSKVKRTKLEAKLTTEYGEDSHKDNNSSLL